jgi:hypothetical protein
MNSRLTKGLRQEIPHRNRGHDCISGDVDYRDGIVLHVGDIAEGRRGGVLLFGAGAEKRRCHK